MQTRLFFRLIGGLVLISQTSARNGMSPTAIPRLTKVANHTFTSLCKDLHNPDLYFDEMVKAFNVLWRMTLLIRRYDIQKASQIIHGFTNDLRMYLMGSGPDEESTMEYSEKSAQAVFEGRRRRNRTPRPRDGGSGSSHQMIHETRGKLNCTKFETDLRIVCNVNSSLLECSISLVCFANRLQFSEVFQVLCGICLSSCNTDVTYS